MKINAARLAITCALLMMLPGTAVLGQNSILPATRSTLPSPVSQSSVLPADSAFKLDVFAEADGRIMFKWEIADGYYLYRNSISAENVDGSAITIRDYPASISKTDEYMGKVEVYYQRLLLALPISNIAGDHKHPDFTLTYQGCAEDLYCYPPQQKHITLELP